MKLSKGWHDLLMTVVGTTISIILTFGTASIVDNIKKRADGRQLAMMAIHDIDNTVDSYREMARSEEEHFKFAQYAMNNPDSIATISPDSLTFLLTTILKERENEHYFDESSERIFLSSQDTWKNIDNATFIDIVQQFFHTRRMTFDTINTGLIWEKPVNEDDYHRQMMKSTNYQLDVAEYLVGKFSDERVRFYINCSPSRQRFFNQCADDCEMISKRCKFIMGITDSEMMRYVEKKESRGRKVRDKDLVGKWVIISNADMYQGFVFAENHRVTTTLIQHYSDPFFTGRLDICYTFNGTWEIQGDSLITVVNALYDCKIDDSNISYLPEKKKYVEDLISGSEATIKQELENSKSSGPSRTAYRVALDPSGNRIEMTERTVDDSGVKEVQYYISREE